MNHRFAHLNKVFVKKGDIVKKGDKIGEMGTSGNSTSSHLHYDVRKNGGPKDYVFGMTKSQVASQYIDPSPHRKSVLPNFTHFGWKYLEKATYGNKTAYHPGEDLNSGAGNSDLGHAIYAPVDGTVIYSYAGTGYNSGWGRIVDIEEKEELPKEEKDVVVMPEPIPKKNKNDTNSVQVSTSPTEKTLPADDIDVSKKKQSTLKTNSMSKIFTDPVMLGAIRHGLTTIGGGFVTAGYISEGELQTTVGAILVLLGVAASIYDKIKK